MPIWLNKTSILIRGLILSLFVIILFQNCNNVGFKVIEAKNSAQAAADDYSCEPGQTMPCEIAGVAGIMTCEATDRGPVWGICVLPPGNPPPPPPTNKSCTLNLLDVQTPITLTHGATYTAYMAANVAASGTCLSEVRVCMNGAMSGSYQYSSCSKSSGQCQVNGVTVEHNSSAEFVEARVVPFGQSCRSENRRCRDGVLDGSYQFAGPCSVAAPANCAFAGDTILHSNFIDVFSSASVPYGSSCVPQRRTCYNGVLDGLQSTITQCRVLPGADCPVGATVVPHTEKRVFARSASVGFGNSCEYAERICTNGTLSGPDFRELSCRAQDALNCTFDGQLLEHGRSVEAFASQSVAYDASCASVRSSVSCFNGSLEGANTHPYRLCRPREPRSCDYFGQTVAHNTPVVSFTSASVPFLDSCESVKKTHTCIDGTFSPALAPFRECNPMTETRCSFNGGSYGHGERVQASKLLSVTEPEVCESEERICNGTTGQFSGSFAYPSCTQQVDLSCRNFVWSSCQRTSNGNGYSCGESLPHGFQPQLVCSGNLIRGLLTNPWTDRGQVGYSSPMWNYVATPENVVGAKCVVNQKFGYTYHDQSFQVLYYDGPPQPGALTTGRTTYPNNQPVIRKVRDCGP